MATRSTINATRSWKPFGVDAETGRRYKAAFERKFPGVELVHVCVARVEHRFTRNAVSLHFIGRLEQLLSFGLVDANMVADLPKRLCHSGGWQEDKETWQTRRLAGGSVEARREILESTDRNQPLGLFGPWNWPFSESAAAGREQAMKIVRERFANLPTVIRMMAEGATMGFVAERGVRLTDRDRSRLASVLSKVEDQMREFASSATFERTDAPALRLIANDGVLL